MANETDIPGQMRRAKMAGLYLEQCSVGRTFAHEIRRTVTDMDNILFSRVALMMRRPQ